MNQLDLFKPERAVPAPRPANPAFIRKHLNRLLNMARAAQRMPWNPSDAAHWAEFFPKLTLSLPPEEGLALREAFAAELDRLRAR